MKISVPISAGELIDKITILNIKASFTNEKFILEELQELNTIKSTLVPYPLQHEKALKAINQKLWGIEDKIRQKEKLQEFDGEFIELARSVYITNDQRAEVKRLINEETNSFIKEIKIFNK